MPGLTQKNCPTEILHWNCAVRSSSVPTVASADKASVPLQKLISNQWYWGQISVISDNIWRRWQSSCTILNTFLCETLFVSVVFYVSVTCRWIGRWFNSLCNSALDRVTSDNELMIGCYFQRTRVNFNMHMFIRILVMYVSVNNRCHSIPCRSGKLSEIFITKRYFAMIMTQSCPPFYCCHHARFFSRTLKHNMKNKSLKHFQIYHKVWVYEYFSWQNQFYSLICRVAL